ncbi:Uncharacterised protein [Vibrio furnissii]|nr:Uncharacterised protein [Vibrio furnissii]
MVVGERGFDRTGAPAHDPSVMKANSASSVHISKPHMQMQKSPIISDKALDRGR